MDIDKNSEEKQKLKEYIIEGYYGPGWEVGSKEPSNILAYAVMRVGCYRSQKRVKDGIFRCGTYLSHVQSRVERKVRHYFKEDQSQLLVNYCINEKNKISEDLENENKQECDNMLVELIKIVPYVRIDRKISSLY